jgi:hypothetical protein
MDATSVVAMSDRTRHLVTGVFANPEASMLDVQTTQSRPARPSRGAWGKRKSAKMQAASCLGTDPECEKSPKR